jgi:hypothetical protein
LFGCNAGRCGCRGWLKRCERRRAGPRLQAGGFDRMQPRAQLGCLIERLARENERDDGNHQRKKIEH